MRFLVSFVCSLVELTASLGKWLFIVTAPVLLIVVVSYYQAGKSYLEPLVGLAVVAGIFVFTYWLTLKVRRLQLHDFRNVPQDFGVTFGLTSGETERWDRHPEDDGRKWAREKEATCRKNRCRIEEWQQANPWGGYNPYE